jgi:prepilin-type N-terminal cleavage/methylation domain-containing protein
MPGQRGFSLIELLVAIMITLIISGSIYGLLAQGQNAFRREPEISDRQQQIRVAMDLVQRDIATAGMGMSEWLQVFTPNLDNVGPANAQGNPTDYLELTGNDGSCLAVSVCSAAAGTPITVVTREPFPTCYRFPSMVMVRGDGTLGNLTLGWVAAAPAGGAGCPGTPEQILVDATEPTNNDPGVTYDWSVANGSVGNPFGGEVLPVQLVRYEIAPDVNGVPHLWRSTTGGRDISLNKFAPGTGADWQIVATGIEDFQVQYRHGNGAWENEAQLVIPAPPDDNYTTLVREVKVTLSARTTGQQNLQGESFSATGVRAIRGSLTSVTAPRAALAALSVGPALGHAQRWQ